MYLMQLVSNLRDNIGIDSTVYSHVFDAVDHLVLMSKLYSFKTD